MLDRSCRQITSNKPTQTQCPVSVGSPRVWWSWIIISCNDNKLIQVYERTCTDTSSFICRINHVGYAVTLWLLAREAPPNYTVPAQQLLNTNNDHSRDSHTLYSDFHYETYIGISPYRILAVVSIAMCGRYVMCDLIEWKNTNFFSFDFGKYITFPTNKVFA